MEKRKTNNRSGLPSFKPFLHTFSWCVFFSLLLCACATTKYVDEGDFLLNETKINVEDNKVAASELEEYLNQTPNKNWLFISKAGLHIYSLSGADTSKRINKFLRKIGSAPVIYDEQQTEKTEKQITKAMNNLGYLNAETFHCTDTTGQKIAITYCIRPREIYTIDSFYINIEPEEMKLLMNSRWIKRHLKIKHGDPFNASSLDELSANITSTFVNMGYYRLTKDNFYFLADTAHGDNTVDITLQYRSKIKKDSTNFDPALQRYHFRNITILNGIEQKKVNRLSKTILPPPSVKYDTAIYGNTTIISEEKKFLRPSILLNNIFIRPSRFYNSKIVEYTHSSLSSLGAVSQVNVEMIPIEEDSAYIDAKITLQPANIYHFQFGIDGTNSAGDLGAASYISLQQKNLFHGSEVFNIKINGSFEHINGKTEYITNNNNYYEFGGELSLAIPRILLPFLSEKYKKQVGATTIFSFGMNWRNRPEYNRRFLSLDWKYTWYSNRRRLFHTLDLYNINYVVSPWTSSWFSDYLNKTGNELLKESYKDQFITRSAYSIAYNSDNARLTHKLGWNIHANLDMAGTLPFLVCSIFPSIKRENGHYGVLGTPFAQYVKASIDVSKTFFVKTKTQFVGHIGLGVAVPFSNSDVMPYEQRFFAGGANTIRGWSTRTLGPGRFNADKNGNFITQTGDVKVFLNFEYRQQTNTFIDLAAFVDAGNVWTIKDYDEQAGGSFNIATFYKEMGLAWGLGIRPNFKFILIRLDAGMQIYNPVYYGSDAWVITHPSSKNFAFHFAIGYPF